MAIKAIKFPAPIAEEVLVRCNPLLGHALQIEGEFTFIVLDNGGGHLASGRVAKLVGRRLMAQVSEYVKPDTCVRIDCSDGLLLGESQACWCEGSAILIVVELLQGLTRLENLALARLREEWGLTEPLESGIRQIA